MKKLIAVTLCLLMVVAVLAGCKGESGKTSTAAQDLTVCTGPDPETIDPALNSAVDGSIMITNCFSGLYGYVAGDDGKPVIAADCAEEVVTPTEIEGGKYQYVITLKEGLKWSDGVEMKASDFIYGWNRAVDPATGADYQYIFDVIDGYSDSTPALNIFADDAARTITIVTTAYCAYFDQLLAFPTYMPIRKDVIDQYGDTWATSPTSYITNGAFKMSDWVVGDKIVFVKNENYWNKDSVKLDSLTFALSDDDDSIFANYSNGTYMLTTNVAVTQIPILKADETRYNVDFFLGDYIGTYYLEFNVNVSFKPGQTVATDDASSWDGWTEAQNSEVRHALGLLIDRNYIVEEVTGGGQQPAYGFVPAGMDDGTGTDFRSKAAKWWSVEKADYDANVAEAIEILKQWYTYDETTKAFTDFPTFQYSFNTSSGNEAIAVAIQDMWSAYGINVTYDQMTWATLLPVLDAGDFTMSRLGWIADYNDPINFLEIFLSSGGNNHPRLGKDADAHSGEAVFGANNDQSWKADYDALIAAIKSESDMAARAELMYQAEAMVQTSYAALPLYYYTNPYLCSTKLIDYLYSPLGWISFKEAYIAE